MISHVLSQPHCRELPPPKFLQDSIPGSIAAWTCRKHITEVHRMEPSRSVGIHIFNHAIVIEVSHRVHSHILCGLGVSL